MLGDSCFLLGDSCCSFTFSPCFNRCYFSHNFHVGSRFIWPMALRNKPCWVAWRLPAPNPCSSKCMRPTKRVKTCSQLGFGDTVEQCDFQGPPNDGTPFPILFPYYSHTTPIRIPEDMGIVWEAYHKGVQLLGVPGITLDSWQVFVMIFYHGIVRDS